MNVAYLECTLCGEQYPPERVQYVCPKHGSQGILDVVYETARIAARTSCAEISESADFSIWRYAELLPLERRESAPPLAVGWTPLYEGGRLGRKLGLPQLYLKDDGRNPTASFKDRASAVVVGKAHELGAGTITTASSGNAGAALAGLAASAGLPAVILVPESAPQAKVAQLLIYGATVVLVRGTYDDAFDLCLEAASEFGWYCRNTAFNPYTTEGKKTAALEICEQLALAGGKEAQGASFRWRAPDRIFVPVGDGNILSGIWKGLRDLRALGWIERLPRLMGVQAEGSAACAKAWRSGAREIEPVQARTIADSISVGLPRDGRRALRAVRETAGEFVTVTDDEILAAMRTLAREAGIFAEPAGAACLAGLERSLAGGQIDPAETIVLVVTGNGLKDIPSALRAAGTAHIIEPNLEALARAIG